MRFISTKTHGVLDYLMGIVLIASPWLFGFDNGGAAQFVPVVVGAVIVVMSVFTNYEMGWLRSVPMPVHLTIDVIGGLFLAVSPWIFGFADLVFLPHLIFGIAEAGAGLMTQKTPAYKSLVY